ncbi:hypothetical protein ABT008_27215 [Micromonospora sp. NPDC002389]|uniref:hypothetical protein n=1 Tax=Micromonospora sp. NPDC002389 TaxID=3154272 RepID=UPI0033236109
MRRQLPLGEPLARGYQFYAFPLAILATEARARDWILSNYIHVAFDPKAPDSPVPFGFYLYDYAVSPWLEVVRTSREWVACVGGDIVALCRDSIGAGYYPYLNLDEHHLPGRAPYQQWHQTHDVLLSGVDDDEGTFTIYGYTANGSLRTTTVGQDDVARAYASLDEVENDCFQVYFYRVRPDASYRMRLHVVGGAFEEYLSGANPSRRVDMLQEEWDRAYGVDSYAPIRGYLRDYLTGDAAYDIRYLHVLWEHKRLMTERFVRLAELAPALSPLVDDCRAMQTDAVALRNGMLWHEQKGRSSRFDEEAMPRLERIFDTEVRVLRQAVEEIRRHRTRESDTDHRHDREGMPAGARGGDGA